MSLILVPPRFVDSAWKDGANQLSEACEEECTPDQLKMLLSREERQLVRMDSDGKTVGWGAFRVDNLPNMRVLFVTNLVAHNGHFESFYEQLKDIAEKIGCSRIRCAAKDVAHERLYRMKLGMKSVYNILEVEV